VTYSLSTLTFLTSGRDLLPPGQTYVQRYEEYAREFGDLDDVTVVIEAPRLAEAKAFANQLARELRDSPERFKRVSYRIDPKQFAGRALLYLSTDKLGEIRDKIFDYQEFMESFAARPTLDQFIDGVNTQVATAFVSSFFDVGLADGEKHVDLRFLTELLGQISDRLDRPVPYHSPWGSLFTVDTRSEDTGYFLSGDERLLFVLIETTSEKGSFTGDREAIETIRAAVGRIKQEFPDVQVGVTGAPALANDEMVSAFRDSQIADLLAFALTLVILVTAFARVAMPLLMLGTLAISLCWSMGLITLTVGHLSIFSVMFISIVIGIGIDYGIYLLFRHDEERVVGRTVHQALETAAARSGPGILIGALTAAGTFYVLMLTDFRGIQELGFIAGTSILAAWLAMMTLFPALIVLADRRRGPWSHSPMPRAIRLEQIRAPFIEQVVRYPKTVLAGAAILTTLSVLALGSVRFDYNLLNLQAPGAESVVWEHRIRDTAGRSGYTALATADSLGELHRKASAFSALDSVSEVDSALLLIPPDQPAKLRIIRDFAPIVAPVRVGMAESADIERLASALETLARRFALAAGEAPAGETRDDIEAIRDRIHQLLGKLRRTERAAAEAALGHLQDEIYQDFASKFHSLQRNLNPRPVGLNDVPDDLRRKFVGTGDRFLLQIHPRIDIWDRDGAEQFTRELRSVDRHVTGTPIITFEAIGLMERGYRQGAVYAFALVVALSFLLIRRVRETALALLPLGLGTLWTVGLMHVFDLPFNLANVFGLPLIIGAASEFGLNVVLNYREGQEHGGPLVTRSTVMAVLVNGLTTIVGFGSLMIADHRGIFGLGLLLTLGMIAALTASLVVLPVLLHRGRPPAPEFEFVTDPDLEPSRTP
jgi:hopanoid biosynthesis associated RND transporter like protein HpnN